MPVSATEELLVEVLLLEVVGLGSKAVCEKFTPPRKPIEIWAKLAALILVQATKKRTFFMDLMIFIVIINRFGSKYYLDGNKKQ